MNIRQFLDKLYLRAKLIWCDTSNDNYVYSEYVLDNVEYRLHIRSDDIRVSAIVGSTFTSMLFNLNTNEVIE